ncbi:MAG: TrbI/VirB10 family protein [Rhizobiales bacterium]|nr:TrbI/VirB10 family protein [Hyphomicrobiales bacterium]
MAEQSRPPEDIELRVRPKPVRRINRKVLMAGTAVLSLVLFGAVLVALDPPDFRGGKEPQELYNTDRKLTAEGLAGLPSSYDAIPKLGPPLPGDIGDAMHKVDTKAPPELPIADKPFQPDPEADIARADRIRLARLAQQGRESKLFYSVATVRKTGEPEAGQQGEAQQPSPFTMLPNPNDATGQPAPQVPQTAQDKKLAFLNGKPDGDALNPHTLQKPVSPYTLMAGSIIPASLITGLNSDLPGFVIGQVTEQVYDTVTGRHLLIPQGTKIIGKYDSVVAFGQKRALVVWQRLIRPDGSSIVIDNLPATDEGGYAGLEDKVDYHTWQLLKGIALATLLGVGTELSVGNSNDDLVAALQQSAAQNTDRAGQSLVQRQLDVQPTITVRPGWPLRIIVHKDLVLDPYPKPNVR